MVAAAGNQADGAVAYPARASSVIAVGATTANGCEAEYSNAGDDLDVVAPGGGIDAPNDDNPWDAAHCRPDEAGRSIFQQTFTRGVTPLRPARRLRGHLDGEPARDRHRRAADRHQAAGRATRDPELVKAHLEQTASDLGPPGFDDRYGYGLVNAATALQVALRYVVRMIITLQGA